MPYDYGKSQSNKSENNKSSSSSSSRPSLGTGMAEKAAKAVEDRKKRIEDQLKQYGA